jgi:hypothetical protein
MCPLEIYYPDSPYTIRVLQEGMTEHTYFPSGASVLFKSAAEGGTVTYYTPDGDVGNTRSITSDDLVVLPNGTQVTGRR